MGNHRHQSSTAQCWASWLRGHRGGCWASAESQPSRVLGSRRQSPTEEVSTPWTQSEVHRLCVQWLPLSGQGCRQPAGCGPGVMDAALAAQHMLLQGGLTHSCVAWHPPRNTCCVQQATRHNQERRRQQQQCDREGNACHGQTWVPSLFQADCQSTCARPTATGKGNTGCQSTASNKPNTHTAVLCGAIRSTSNKLAARAQPVPQAPWPCPAAA